MIKRERNNSFSSVPLNGNGRFFGRIPYVAEEGGREEEMDRGRLTYCRRRGRSTVIWVAPIIRTWVVEEK